MCSRSDPWMGNRMGNGVFTSELGDPPMMAQSDMCSLTSAATGGLPCASRPANWMAGAAALLDGGATERPPRAGPL